MLAALADPGAASQIGYARWRNDFPDGADWFSLLLSGSAIRTGSNLNYALLDDDRVGLADRARLIDVGRGPARGALVAGRAGRPRPRALGAVRTACASRHALRRGCRGYMAHQLYGFLWMRARVD